MRALLDTGVWWRWMTHGPISAPLRHFLEVEVDEHYLCPVSLLEALYKVTHKKERAPGLADWQERMIEGFRLAPVTFAAGRLAGEWAWAHGDPIDRLLAAVAATENLTLVHTDRALKDLPGFPQRYFRGTHVAT